MNQNKVRASKELVSYLIKINTDTFVDINEMPRYFIESTHCNGLPDSNTEDGWHLCFGPTIIVIQ